jgi:signal transduction histidine kinase
LKNRLRYTLTATFTLIAIIPVLFIGIWVERSSYLRELSSVEEKHLLLAKNITNALELYTHDAAALFGFLCESAERDDWPEGAAALAKSLDFRHFAIYSPAGALRKSLHPAAADSAILPSGGISAFDDLIAEEGRLFSGVMADAAGRPTIYLVEPLDSGDIAVGAMGIRYVAKLQGQITFGERGHAAIVDRDGRIIAHPNPDWSREMKNISAAKPVGKMIEGESGVTEFYSPAVKADMITGYTVVPGVGWGVMVPQPLEELRQKAAAARGAEIAIMVGGLLLAALLGWFISGLLIRPIAAVVGAAERIGKGDLEARVSRFPKVTPREYRELGMAFNRMAGRIQDERRQLAAAAHAADLASQSKSEFLANVSHELRTPLNAIIGFSEAMLEKVFGELGNKKYGEYAAHIHSSGQHLLSIINDILDLSKVEAGKLEFDVAPVSLDKAMTQAVTIIRGSGESNGAKIEVEDMSGLPDLRASEQRLLQIFVNLLSNAVKFTPEGGTVNVRAEMRGGDIVTTIIDDGIGMTAEDLEKAMLPFTQVDSSLTRRFEGTGLGLPLAKLLVEGHGGTLHMESEPGSGTMVTVRLPIVEQPGLGSPPELSQVGE